MTKRIRVAHIAVVMGLSLAGLVLAGLVLAGEAKDKYKDLDLLNAKDTQIDFWFKEQDLRKVFGVLEKVANINISFGEGLTPGTRITVSFHRVTVKKVLIDLAEKYALDYEVTDPDSLIVKGVVPKSQT